MKSNYTEYKLLCSVRTKDDFDSIAGIVYALMGLFTLLLTHPLTCSNVAPKLVSHSLFMPYLKRLREFVDKTPKVSELIIIRSHIRMQLCILSCKSASSVRDSFLYDHKLVADSKLHIFFNFAMHLVYMVQTYGRFAPLSCMWAHITAVEISNGCLKFLYINRCGLVSFL